MTIQQLLSPGHATQKPPSSKRLLGVFELSSNRWNSGSEPEKPVPRRTVKVKIPAEILFPFTSQRVMDTTCEAVECEADGVFKVVPKTDDATAKSWITSVATATSGPQSVIS